MSTRRRRATGSNDEAAPSAAAANTDASPASDDTSWMSTGAAVKEDVAAEKEQRQRRAAESRQPRRFWLSGKASKGLTEKEVVILNDSLDDAMGVYEHEIWQPAKKRTIYRASPKKWEEDPLIEILGKEPAYVTYLSVLTLVPWKDSKGNEHEYSRELIGIKHSQLDQFWKILDNAQKNNGTLRGTCLYLARDTSNAMSPKIGTPQPYDDGRVYDFMTAEELLEDFGHDAITDDKGKEIIEKDGLLKAYTNAQIYPNRPSAKALREEFGGTAPLGGGDDEDDFKPKDGGRQRRQRQQLPAQGGAKLDDGAAFDDGDDNPFND